MGRELQKRKNRSSRSKVKHKQPTKSGKKKVNVVGSAIVAANWDKSQTLIQNYRRLGLTSRLHAPTGGREKIGNATATDSIHPDFADTLYISNDGNKKTPANITSSEIRVERDPTTGAILRVIRPDGDAEQERKRQKNPLNDPLNDLSDSGSDGEALSFSKKPTDASGIAHQLEQQAEQEALRPRKKRHQSRREEEWIVRLVDKYGDDFKSMSRDKKMNVMQQSEGDLRKRVERWKVERENDMDV